MRTKQSQSGVVMVLVLMVLALASVLCADLVKDAINYTDLTQHEVDSQDIEQILLGGEAWAMSRISELKQNDRVLPYKMPDKPWILDSVEFESDLGGVVRVILANRSSCIDVNGLFRSELAKPTREQLVALSTKLGVDSMWIQQLVNMNTPLDDQNNQETDNPIHYLELSVAGIEPNVLIKLYPYVCFNETTQPISITSQSGDLLEALLPNSNKQELHDQVDALVTGNFDVDSFNKLIAASNANGTLNFVNSPTNVSAMIEYRGDNTTHRFYSDLVVNDSGLVSPISRSFVTEKYHQNLFNLEPL